MQIIKVDFKKDENNKTILTDQENIDKLIQYVFPIIENNEGWGSGDLTKEKFLQDPPKYQDTIDASVWKNVHILTDDNVSVGLLEFGKTTLSEHKERHTILSGLLDGQGIEDAETALGRKFDLSLVPDIKKFLDGKIIYSAVGVALTPNLQNKKTGYSEKLYEIIKDGLIFGWTSNPVVVRKRRSLYKNTLFFPAFNDFPNTAEEWAVCLYVYAYVISHPRKDYEGLNFGAMYSPYFVEERGKKYLEIAKEMSEKGKITDYDEKRIHYVLSKKACSGAIVSWN